MEVVVGKGGHGEHSDCEYDADEEENSDVVDEV